MSEVESSKTQIIRQLKGLCAHCANSQEHVCPMQEITARIENIRGIPLMVNDEFRGMLWT
jgi:hypothetical protein